MLQRPWQDTPEYRKKNYKNTLPYNTIMHTTNLQNHECFQAPACRRKKGDTIIDLLLNSLNMFRLIASIQLKSLIY